MKTRYALVAAAALIPALPGRAQEYNALDFDGIDDQVTVPAASALITSGTGITLTCWAYPTNAAPVFPDFDGFAGLRDDFTADFYLLQIAPANTVEGRFRNNSGQAFTLAYAGLQLNAWQFLALSYTGGQLILYANGVNVASIPANGTIASSFVDLFIGNVYYQGTDFLLDGRVDEVSLWNRSLTPNEVACMYTNGIDVGADGLQLYYKMDQGVGGANNAGITALLPSKGVLNGALSGFALNGAASNFVSSPQVGTTVAATLCPGGTYAFNGVVLDEPGVYGTAYDVAGACDSLVLLNLALYTVNTQTSAIEGVITSLAADGTWQWLDCNNGHAEVPGATAQQFAPEVSGSYAVEVTQFGCADTSACVDVIITTLGAEAMAQRPKVFPNPAQDHVRVEIGATAPGVVLSIEDATGRCIRQQVVNGAEAVSLSLLGMEAGVYFIRLRSGQADVVSRLVKH